MSLTVSSSPSPFVAGIEPITESDDELRTALADAELPPLLPALAYLTGDLGLLRPELRPDALMIAMPQGGLTDDQQAQVRELALAALISYRDGGCHSRGRRPFRWYRLAPALRLAGLPHLHRSSLAAPHRVAAHRIAHAWCGESNC